jgi:nicotinate-nucleotide adenylyltransferase
MPAPHAVHVIYGGTFDPVHRGHVAIAGAARVALQQAGLAIAQFDFLPNADPPHRALPGAAAGHRVAMLWLALADAPGFGIDLRELRRGGASYMVDTLEELRAELGPETPLVLLLGEDAWSGFERWQRWRDIPGLCHLLIVNRPQARLEPLSPALIELQLTHSCTLSAFADAPAEGICRIELPPEAGSATAVRTAAAAEDAATLQALLLPEVAAYIERLGLYRSPAPLVLPSST